MSELIIRESSVEDLQGVADLFLPRKRSLNMLHWLHSDGKGQLQSFVAEVDKKIVGHIGYMPSGYNYNGDTLKGVFSIEWKVDEDYAGQAALKLYSKVMKIGDFTYVIGGTEVVNKMYPLLKFRVAAQIPRFQKIVRPMQYFRLLDETHNPVKRALKTAFYTKGMLGGKKILSDRHVKLTSYDTEIAEYLKPPQNVIENEGTRDFERLMETPGVEAYRFLIRKKGEPVGSALCMIDRAGNYAAGRIVHISHLGKNQDLWEQAVRKCETFLWEQGCCIISSLGSNELYTAALRKSGHIFLKNSPLWLRDRKNILKDADWHFTYLEGDLAHRGIYTYDFTKKDYLKRPVSLSGKPQMTTA